MKDRVMPTILLDYDGYVAKSFYAGIKDGGEAAECLEVLESLFDSAVDRAREYFNTNYIRVFKIMSGHTYKKDIYPSYKGKRKRDPMFAAYRELVLKTQTDIIKPQQLEADDLLVLMADRLLNCIVFSDDKDLRYYCQTVGGINLTAPIVQQNFLTDCYPKQIEQMLAGDSEDDIAGVPKVGMKTAKKLLDNTEHTIDQVVRIYKEKGVDIDSCLRDLVLVSPLSEEMILAANDTAELVVDAVLGNREPEDSDVQNLIIAQFQRLNKIVKEVYYN